MCDSRQYLDALIAADRALQECVDLAGGECDALLTAQELVVGELEAVSMAVRGVEKGQDAA